MYKNLFILFIFVLTIIICSIKPCLHKTIIFSEPFIKESQEETQIDWAKWHSAVLNELILRSKSAPSSQPFETLNHVEFDVDNQQNIINIKIHSEPQQYSQQAKKHFSPVVRGLAGNNVLKFPQGSQRKLVHFKSVLKKSDKTELSSPQDFYDYEILKVK